MDGPQRTSHRVRPGHLGRCCLASLDMHILLTKTPPAQGDTLQCGTHCVIVFNDGAWEWAGAALSVFRCPVCFKVSHNPEDKKNGYCGACHQFTGGTNVES